jgi:TetR/AcrR family transcriptional regulator, tetracycline repressor protein
MAVVRPKLDRGMVLDQALILLQEEGFDALSLRKLAARLGVQAPAIYWYFADRADLLTAMVDALDERASTPRVPPTRELLGQWIMTRGANWRDILMGVRDSARLIAEATARPNLHEVYMQQVRQAEGLTERDVIHCVSVLNAFVVGWVNYEQQSAMQRFMAGIMDIDAAFNSGLRALASGLMAELDPRPAN